MIVTLFAVWSILSGKRYFDKFHRLVNRILHKRFNIDTRARERRINNHRNGDDDADDDRVVALIVRVFVYHFLVTLSPLLKQTKPNRTKKLNGIEPIPNRMEWNAVGHFFGSNIQPALSFVIWIGDVVGLLCVCEPAELNETLTHTQTHSQKKKEYLQYNFDSGDG